MIDPKRITNFERTDAELDAFAIFTVLVAGKNSDTTARLVGRLLEKAGPNVRPLGYLHCLGEVGLRNYLVVHRVGQYGRITGALMGLAQLNLRTCTLADLLAVPGVGPKTARFFLLHSRRDVDCAVLDVHVLAWMRQQAWDTGLEIPKQTPQGAAYLGLERLYAAMRRAAYPAMSAADADLLIWASMSGRLDVAPPELPGIKEVDALAAELADKLKAHDHSFEYSDDHRVWERGNEQAKEIRSLRARIAALTS